MSGIVWQESTDFAVFTMPAADMALLHPERPRLPTSDWNDPRGMTRPAAARPYDWANDPQLTRGTL